MSFDILDPRVDAYLKQLNAKHDDPVLLDMETRAQEHDFPIVDRLCGSFLEALALTIGATTVFEMGSGYGYSAWWFTRAVGASGKVWCTDGSEENRDLAERYLTQAGRWDRVEYHVGWAQEVLKATPGDFDIVYSDVDKPQYPDTWLQAKDRVRPGGLSSATTSSGLAGSPMKASTVRKAPPRSASTTTSSSATPTSIPGSSRCGMV